MELTSSDWVERYAIDSGYYSQGEVIAVLGRFLKPGHCFVDVGVDIGFLTLTAALGWEKWVEQRGRVLDAILQARGHGRAR